MRKEKKTSEYLKQKYYQLHTVYSKMKIKKNSRRKVKKHLTDKILTIEQKQKIKEFYKPYKNITTDFHEFYYQKTGKFCVNYIPDDFYFCNIDMYFNNWILAATMDNKCFYRNMFPDVKQPETFAYRINNFWYTGDMKSLTQEQLIDDLKKQDKLFVKVAVESAGGKGVYYIDNKNNDIVDKFFQAIASNEKDLVVQKALQQHEVLASLNESSVNTIRIISLLTKEGVKIYSAILRMGIGGAKVDNASSGGITCGIDEKGYLKDVAYFVDGRKYDKHPTSGVKFSKVKIPSFDKACEMVVKTHPLISHSRLASWDIAIDPEGNVILIEAGLKYGELDFHQLNNGPVFGDDTKAILDEVFGK